VSGTYGQPGIRTEVPEAGDMVTVTCKQTVERLDKVQGLYKCIRDSTDIRITD
jgi:hypothetical protein